MLQVAHCNHKLIAELCCILRVHSGHRIGTAEVESALVSHPQCAEAAVVGVEHEVKTFLHVFGHMHSKDMMNTM